ncbi:MAG: hypothetical protein Q4C47_07845 [Planctomycetia bacterium]|nr:hypothetical protein [Planctomycetia bacterium]
MNGSLPVFRYACYNRNVPDRIPETEADGFPESTVPDVRRKAACPT